MVRLTARRTLQAWFASALLASAMAHAPAMAQEAEAQDARIARLEAEAKADPRWQTLLQLAQAYAPANPRSRPEFERGVPLAVKAGDYFAAAYALSGDTEHAAEAGRQYLAAYDWTVVGRYNYDLFPDADRAGLRARAVEWLEKGMKAGSGKAWTNYGALLLGEGKRKEARAAFERGAKADVAVAYQHLGQMAEADREADAQAFSYYERALALGYLPARRHAFRALLNALNKEQRLDALGRGIQRLQELRDPVEDRQYEEDVDDLLYHYDVQKELAAKEKATRAAKARKKR